MNDEPIIPDVEPVASHRVAVVEDGTVTNIVLIADDPDVLGGWQPPDGAELVRLDDDDVVHIGGRYASGKFHEAPAAPIDERAARLVELQQRLADGQPLTAEEKDEALALLLQRG